MVSKHLIHGKVKRVGNSIAIFVTAEEREKYNLVPESEIVLDLVGKKVVKSLFGVCKGKLGPWTEEDRADFHGDWDSN